MVFFEKIREKYSVEKSASLFFSPIFFRSRGRGKNNSNVFKFLKKKRKEYQERRDNSIHFGCKDFTSKITLRKYSHPRFKFCSLKAAATLRGTDENFFLNFIIKSHSSTLCQIVLKKKIDFKNWFSKRMILRRMILFLFPPFQIRSKFRLHENSSKFPSKSNPPLPVSLLLVRCSRVTFPT